MKISVVIPAYNEEKLLPATLESIQKLTRKPEEILVIDNGSTDRTASIAKKYGARVIYVPDKGIARCRQKGLEESSGEIVAFTDADTVVPPNWLQIIEETLREKNVVAIVGSFLVSDGAWWYKIFTNILQPPLMKLMYNLGLPTASGQNIAFYKNAALRAGGFPVTFKLVEDNDMYRRLTSQGKVQFRSDFLVTTSGRRSREGLMLPIRYFFVFLIYFIFRRGDIIGFRDYR